MNREDRNQTIWPETPPQAETELDKHFVGRVVERVHRKLLYRDILFLSLLGFFSVCLGLLKLGSRRPEVHQAEEIKP